MFPLAPVDLWYQEVLCWCLSRKELPRLVVFMWPWIITEDLSRFCCQLLKLYLLDFFCVVL